MPGILTANTKIIQIKVLWDYQKIRVPDQIHQRFSHMYLTGQPLIRSEFGINKNEVKKVKTPSVSMNTKARLLEMEHGKVCWYPE